MDSYVPTTQSAWNRLYSPISAYIRPKMSKKVHSPQTIIYMNPWPLMSPICGSVFLWACADSCGFKCMQAYSLYVDYTRYYFVTNRSWGVETEDTTLGWVVSTVFDNIWLTTRYLAYLVGFFYYSGTRITYLLYWYNNVDLRLIRSRRGAARRGAARRARYCTVLLIYCSVQYLLQWTRAGGTAPRY
jgi:hypothetical protein